MYILSRSSSSPSSCLVTSRLVSFLSIFFNPRPLARRCVFKIGLDENPSASVSDDVYRISYNRPSSRFLPFPFSRGSSKAERKRRPFSLARDRPDFSHPSRPARSDRAIRKRDPPYSNICFRSDRFFFSSPTPLPSHSSYDFFVSTDGSDRETRYITRMTESPVEERGSIA